MSDKLLSAVELADNLADRFNSALLNLPLGFFDSFKWTSTGRNLSHPITWGHLFRLLWEVPGTSHVGIDVRLNLGSGIKFQPDLVAMNDECESLLFLDYESPNSSDSRIPTKDVDPYVRWCKETGSSLPYLVITTLPDKPSSEWELRYTAKDYYNAAFKGKASQIRKNPFRFWYDYYRKELSKRNTCSLIMLNINSGKMSRKYPLDE